MNVNEFLEELKIYKDSFNYLENCPYIYGQIEKGILCCPITYLALRKLGTYATLNNWKVAADLLNLVDAERIVKATDNTGEEELNKNLKEILCGKSTSVIGT